MNDHASNLQSRSQTCIERGILSPEAIDFYHALFRYRYNEYERYLKKARMPEIRSSDCPLALQGMGAAINDASRAIITPGLDQLIGLLSQHHPGLDFRPFQKAILEKNIIMDDFLDALMKGDPGRMELLAHQHKISADEAVFVISNWLNPYFVLLCEMHRDVIPAGNTTHLCPFCGYYPDMSAISAEKDGKRYLHCSLCEHEWPYLRIACAVCGSDDAEKLEFFSVEGEPSYRIELCRACEGYIKTVRLDKFGETAACDLVVENIITPHLDSAALKAGFRRP
jgi:hypothetical protein